MKHTTQVQLIERVLTCVKNRTTHMVEESSRQHVSVYISPERLAQEREAIFQRYPIMLAHSSQLANAGDYLCHDEAGLPILLLRANNGEIRAFLNVCRHRGTRLVMEKCGSAKKSIACPYHSWTYDQTGKLQHMPHKIGFPELACEDLNLVSLPVAERFGFIWAVLTPNAPIDIDDLLDPIAEDLESFNFASHVGYQPKVMEKALNWKIGIEIFLEGYHVQHAHRDTIAPIFLDNIGLYDRFFPHMRNIFPKKKITELSTRDKSEWDIRTTANVLYYIFPNCFMLVEPDHASVFTIFPKDTDSAIITNLTLLPELPTTEKAERYWQKNIEILDNATAEDFQMGESIQRGLRSGVNEYFNYARYEQSLRYLHESIDAALSGGATRKREKKEKEF